MQGEFPQPIVVKSGDATSNKPVEFQPRHDFSSFQVQWERGEVMGQFQPNDSFHDAAEMIDLLERFTIEVVKLDQDRPHAITVEFKYPVGKAGLVDLEAADPEVTMLTLPIGDNFREVPVVFRPEGPSTNLVTYIVKPNDGVFQITNAYPGIPNPDDMTNKAYVVNDDTITNLFARREVLNSEAVTVQDDSVKTQRGLLDHALIIIRNLSDEYYLNHPKYIIDEDQNPTLARYVREVRAGRGSDDYYREFIDSFRQLHTDVIAEAEFIHS